MRESSLVGPEGAGEQVDDLSSDEEQATTASETEAESENDDEATPPEEPWCPPIPPAMDDPTEQEIKGAADKLATMISSSQPSAVFSIILTTLEPFHICGCKPSLASP